MYMRETAVCGALRSYFIYVATPTTPHATHDPVDPDTALSAAHGTRRGTRHALEARDIRT